MVLHGHLAVWLGILAHLQGGEVAYIENAQTTHI